MPFDGVTVRAAALELKSIINESRIDKIHMPEKDEVIVMMRNYKGTHRLKISMNPAYSGIYLTDLSKENPLSPPNFCMFLRKHISGGIIRDILSYDYERYIGIVIESRSELGDMQHKTLIIELTGRNCNIILLNASGVILDSYRHIDSDISSVREIMPARKYEFIPSQDKVSPEEAKIEDVFKIEDASLSNAILKAIKGFSPILCKEVCYRADIDENKSTDVLTDIERLRLTESFNEMLSEIKQGSSNPCVVFNEKKQPVDFHSIKLSQYPDVQTFGSLNKALDYYFSNRGEKAQLDLKKTDLVKAISRNIKRCQKKISIHVANVEKADSIENFKLTGELITSSIHRIKPNTDKIEVLNYYTGEMIEIALDPNKDAARNAQVYFKKYKKGRSAVENSKLQLKDALDEISYLESVEHNLSAAVSPDDVNDIRRELSALDYVKKKHPKYKKKEAEQKFRPYRYISSEGYEIYAGRNNIENDYLTFKFANSRDLWLHAKGIPGSHVIIRKKDKHEELFPDKTISEAAVIAAYHSRAKNSGQIAVDYSEAKNIKKPGNSKPGMVNYFVYFSAYATADETLVKKLFVK